MQKSIGQETFEIFALTKGTLRNKLNDIDPNATMSIKIIGNQSTCEKIEEELGTYSFDKNCCVPKEDFYGTAMGSTVVVDEKIPSDFIKIIAENSQGENEVEVLLKCFFMQTTGPMINRFIEFAKEPGYSEFVQKICMEQKWDAVNSDIRVGSDERFFELFLSTKNK